MFDSPEQAHQALTEAGYLTDEVTATTVYRIHPGKYILFSVDSICLT